jgi:hypothetical protein
MTILLGCAYTALPHRGLIDHHLAVGWISDRGPLKNKGESLHGMDGTVAFLVGAHADGFDNMNTVM